MFAVFCGKRSANYISAQSNFRYHLTLMKPGIVVLFVVLHGISSIQQNKEILLSYTMANVKEHMQGLGALIVVKTMHVRLHVWLTLISTGISFISITKNVTNLLVGDTTTTTSL